MFEKLTQLSELPVFTGGRTEHALFAIVLVAFLTLSAVTIILIAKYSIKGIENMWEKICEIRITAINAKTQREQEYTKQIVASGKTSKSQF